MGTEYDAILKSIKTFMENNGSKEVEGELNKEREIEQHLQAINQMISDPEQNFEDSTQGLEAVRDACESVTHGKYLPAKAEAAALSVLVDDMKIENFPETIRPKGIEIKGYLDDISAQLQRVNCVVNELAKKVSQSVVRQSVSQSVNRSVSQLSKGKEEIKSQKTRRVSQV